MSIPPPISRETYKNYCREERVFLILNQTFMEALKSVKYLDNNFNSAAEVIFAHNQLCLSVTFLQPSVDFSAVPTSKV